MNNIIKYALLALALFSKNTIISQNLKVNDTILIKKQDLEEVIVSAFRASKDTPMSFIEIDAKDIAPLNLGQDLPTILNFTPSVVTHSDAGNGVGYSAMHIRGSDETRVNVTLNGIPLNDSESQLVYWVNMPDLSSSISNIQIQRGVGTSTNGSGAFGGSINILTDIHSDYPLTEISNSFGSYGTLKNSINFSTGLSINKIEFSELNLSSPLLTYVSKVPKEWADYNDHMTEARYLECFSEATTEMMSIIGADEEYILNIGSYFTVETHIRHLDEVQIGESIKAKTQVIFGENKKLHLFHWLNHEDGRLLATAEHMLIHVDLKTRGASMPNDLVLKRMGLVYEAHKKLPRPEGINRAVGDKF